MRIECEHCGAGYSVADEKIAGRAVKLRCKNCGEMIRVDGRKVLAATEAASAPAASASQVAVAEAAGVGQSEPTPDYGPDPFGDPEPEPAYAEAAPEAAPEAVAESAESAESAVWHIAAGDTTQGPYTLEELATYYAQGTVVLDTLVFRDGWADWRPAGEVEELRQLPEGAAAFAQGSPSAVAMGADPFGEPEVAHSPRVSAQQLFAKGPTHEGTVQFSMDEIKAISSVSVPSTLPGMMPAPLPSAQAQPGYASGEGSGLIDMRALAGLAALSTSDPGARDDLSRSPLDTLTPLALPTTPPPEDTTFRMKLYAGVAAFAMLLAAGVGVLAIVYQPPQPASVAAVAQPPQQVLEGSNLSATAPSAAAQAGEETEAVEEAEAQTAPPAAAQAEAEDNESAGTERARVARRSGEPARAAKRAASARAKNEGGGKQEKSGDEDLFAKPSPNPAKSAPASSKAKGGDSIDDLLAGALSGKQSAPKAEAKPAASNLPQAPSREAVQTAFKQASAKTKRCPGSGVATANITIAGSTGRASAVEVTGVTGAAKSCVEKAVRGTAFPKFQRDSFKVALPFRLAG